MVQFLNPNVEDLKRLRLISKSWLEATRLEWKKLNAVVKITPTRSNLINKTDGFLVSVCFNQTEEPYYMHANFPFVKFKFEGFEVDESFFDQSTGYLNIIWSLFGKTVEYVNFEKCTFVSVKGKTLLQMITNNLPNLKHVALTQVKVNELSFFPNFENKLKESSQTLRLLTCDEKVLDFMQEVRKCS